MKIIFVFTVAILFCGCPDGGVNPPTQPDFVVTAEEIISTEALLKIQYSTTDSITVQLVRNGELLTTVRMSKEFVFNDTTLLPKQSCTYIAKKIENGKAVATTPALQITTLDTTTHDFIWETTTFGGTAGSCTLNDVAIINDTLAYAVGEIYLPDSTGQNEIYYNAAKWNGKKWELMQIKVMHNGNLIIPSLYGVYGFSYKDIWFSSGVPIHGDGNNWLQYHLFDMGILTQSDGALKKIWGSQSKDIFFVGDLGTIIHYNGTSWQKLESGTTLNMQDIWGVVDDNGNFIEAYCGATTDDGVIHATKFLHISSNNKIEFLPWNSHWFIASVWSVTKKTVYLSGGVLLQYRNDSIREKDFGLFISRVRGNSYNDIFIAGSYGFIAHYNGNTWREYRELLNTNVAYRSLSVKGNTIVTCGFYGEKAIVTVGKKIQQ